MPTEADELIACDLELRGRVMPASNATFLADAGSLPVIYKPVRGERPLWDFPDGTLAEREVAAHAVSEALGWNVVPRTVLRNGPHGLGMVQVWQETDDTQNPVDIVPRGATDAGLLHVLDAWDDQDRPIALVHEDTAPLRHMALFDVVINNGDRKGGHVLPMPDGHRFGVDHGVAFHVENKLRTVLWGWAGTRLTDEERATVAALADNSQLRDCLEELLTLMEVRAFVDRVEQLAEVGEFPHPGEGWPSIPWPAF